ncbi:unnamed protein product [Protopolystoma xenopodis]|uniref:Uncharacterized protein n=1 Tax=Protopolystoma xenopodis TaxID=117903 RepID=A0A448XBA1_9PLAT|nr:unnamed protein product [Protopolystoma xenopodis]
MELRRTAQGSRQSGLQTCQKLVTTLRLIKRVGLYLQQELITVGQTLHNHKNCRPATSGSDGTVSQTLDARLVDHATPPSEVGRRGQQIAPVAPVTSVAVRLGVRLSGAGQDCWSAGQQIQLSVVMPALASRKINAQSEVARRRNFEDGSWYRQDPTERKSTSQTAGGQDQLG